MNYDLIPTLGPASKSPSVWEKMLESGVTRFRLNTSHLDLESLEDWLKEFFAFCKNSGKQPTLVLDLQGSKWRLGNFEAFKLVDGEELDIYFSVSAKEQGLPVPHADFFEAARTSNGEIVLNDAKNLLKILRLEREHMRVKVVRGGLISAHKGITFRQTEYRKEKLSEKDKNIFSMTEGVFNVQYAISYVKDASEMQRYRETFGPQAFLAAKLERGSALQEAPGIAAYADELWVCRGDLGAELGLKQMAISLSEFNQMVKDLPVGVIMAGQVLEHMTKNPVPTRSEVCYLLDSLERGYQGFVLSDETAVGENPLEACKIGAMFLEN